MEHGQRHAVLGRQLGHGPQDGVGQVTLLRQLGRAELLDTTSTTVITLIRTRGSTMASVRNAGDVFTVWTGVSNRGIGNR